MYRLYRIFTQIISPVVPVVLRKRVEKGKEDSERLGERLGIASVPRLEGKLVWIHAASVGESNSVLPLIDVLAKAHPSLHILLTTVTLTSAKMVAGRLPKYGIHQFVPVDTAKAVDAFLDYWRPDVALWVDSELWPNIIAQAKKRGVILGIINARMSRKSFGTWQYAKGFIRQVLGCFTFCFAQSEEDRDRLLQLGIPQVNAVCNLKYDAPVLHCDARELAQLETEIKHRTVWVAASTHPGEEKIIAGIHKALKAEIPDLLTIIVPRHAVRGDAIAQELEGHVVAVQRSKKALITQGTDIYIADTMGELGLFYRLVKVAFIGGTLVEHGGQNPLEAARLGCAVVMGPHFDNFSAVVNGLREHDAVIVVLSGDELLARLRQLFSDQAALLAFSHAARREAQSRSGAINIIMNELQPYIS